jgi:HSP20 family molecular chaperone IbpA
MTSLLPELSSVRLREAANELVVAVELPAEVDLSRISTRLAGGVLEIRLPRVRRPRERLLGFHPDASGV